MSGDGYFKKRKSFIPFFLTGILLSTGCSSDEIKKVADTYANGDPRIIRLYEVTGNDSICTGEQVLYQNGQPQLEGSFCNDTLYHGLWTIWYEDGKKNAETVFEKGLRQGDWQVWDFDGNLLAGDRVQMELAEDGFPLIIRYFGMEGENLVNIGEVHFYSNHLKKTEGPVSDDKKHGLWKAWYSNGGKWSQGVFQHDVNHGLHTVWHENGKKFYEGSYFVGQRTGIWNFWDENGRLVKELNYSEVRNNKPPARR